eukprot:m.136362 g.136362  ORF g.136362 m.136362 type:complete len:422 (+) comp16583_c0_seq1:72-1337(+)
MDGNAPDDAGDRQLSAQAMKERRLQMAKERQKKAATMMISSNDTKAAPTTTRAPSADSTHLAEKIGASLVLSPSASSWLDDEEENNTGAAIAPCIASPIKTEKTTSKFEKTMMEEGFQAEYTPKSDSLRFEGKPVAPAVQPAGSPATHRAQKSPAAAASDYLFFEDLENFVRQPAPVGMKVLCCIHRDKSSGMFPTYTLKLERTRDGVHEKIFLLAGRKRKMSKTSNYIISTSEEDLSREGDNFMGKLRANFVGTQFTLFDDGVNPGKRDAPEAVGKTVRKELAAMVYDANVLGWSGPRKMTVIIPNIKDGEPIVIQPEAERDSLLERAKTGRIDGLLVLRNKQPDWNEATSSYVLNFHGRVTQASVKNFQIVHESDPDYIVMQFGRNEENVFSMDFMHPMSALQAFAIALSSFDGKLACE